VFLAIVLDVFSRKVVGWDMANHLRTELVLAALNMAIAQRRPQGVIHHSDKGARYTSLAFGKRCREAAVVTSTGPAGDCCDNAMAESFFATLECELIDRRSFQIRTQTCMPTPDFARLRNTLFPLRYLSLVYGRGWRRTWQRPIITASSGSVASLCRRLRAPAIFAEVRGTERTCGCAATCRR